LRAQRKRNPYFTVDDASPGRIDLRSVYNTSFMTILIRLCFVLFISLPAFTYCQDNTYGHFGFTFQTGTLGNAYHADGELYGDSFSGPGAFFGREEFGEDYTSHFNFDGGLVAVMSIFAPRFVPRVNSFAGRRGLTNGSEGYLLYTPLLDFGAAVAVDKNNRIGPTFQMGLEAMRLLTIDEEGRGDADVSNSFGAQYTGLVTFGTGVQLFQPFRKFGFDDSRITLNVDWMLGREYGDKWALGGRMRYSLEAVGMLARRFQVRAFYHFVNFKRSYWIENPQSLEFEPVNSVMHLFGVGVGFNFVCPE
jgi:hypothetical protein